MCPGTSFRFPYTACTKPRPGTCTNGCYIPGTIVAYNTMTPPGVLCVASTTAGKCWRNTYKQKMSFGLCFTCLLYIGLSYTNNDGYVCYTVCSPAYCRNNQFNVTQSAACVCTICCPTICVSGSCNYFIGIHNFCALKDWGANPTTPFVVETEFKVPSNTHPSGGTGYFYPNRLQACFSSAGGTCEKCCCADTAMPIAAGCLWVGNGILPQHVYSCCCTGTDGCYESLAIMESNDTSYNAFPSVTHCRKQCFGCSGGTMMTHKPLQNRMWCCDYAQGANPTGWMNNYFAVKAARSCGTITNISGSTLTVTLYARANDCNFNFCYCSLVSCSLAAGGYWNYDVTYCNIMQAAACYAYNVSPYGGNALYLCITPYVGSACRVEVCSNFSYCVNRNNDLYVGVGYGTL